jgi:peptidoglycan/LPS O-acetylase OafA/YrhL
VEEFPSIMLYLTSFVPFSNSGKCLNHLWFLSADMIFFCLIPLFVKMYARSRTTFYKASLSIIFGNALFVALLTYILEITGVGPYGENTDYIYRHPWARIAECQCGVVFAMIYHEYKQGSDSSNGQEKKFGYFFFETFKGNSKLMNLIF